MERVPGSFAVQGLVEVEDHGGKQGPGGVLVGIELGVAGGLAHGEQFPGPLGIVPEDLGLLVVKLLQNLDPIDLRLMIFSDHHQYDTTDLQKIHQASVSLGADLIVTTEKDQPKITSWNNQPNIYVISVEPVIPEAFGLLVDTILRREVDEIKTSME